MRLLGVLLILLGAGAGYAQEAQTPEVVPPTADAIMARVAENQDRSEKLRSEYVYKQHIHIVTRKTNGKLQRQETADYRVLPTPDGTKRELEKITGRYLRKGKYVDFTGEPVPEHDSLDGNLVRDFRDSVSNEKSKDGLESDLFPLTTKQQEKCAFRLIGEETLQGRPAYRIAFRPKEKDDFTWAGEAVIDKEDFQPVTVFTKLSRRIPFAVRTLLGTDLPGIGFNVKYQRQPDGVWFPVGLGTEFRLHVLFFLNRDISVSLQNSSFQRTDVKSTVKYEALQ